MRPRSLDEFLRKAGVPYTTFSHPEAFTAQHGAAVSHVPGRSWAKTVVCIADDQPILAVVPAHLRVDLERLRLLAAARTLRLAREEEVVEVYPDCEPGAMPPFHTASPLRVFVDVNLVGEPDMVFNAGTHSDALRMHYEDFADIVHPIVGTFGQPAAATARSTPIT